MMTRALALTLLLVSTFALSACGLTPVYGDYTNTGQNAVTSAALNSIYIDNIPDRTGQRVRNLLTDRLYLQGRPGANAQYRLGIAKITESIAGLGIAKDATATRSQIRLSTTMVLTSTSGESLFSRKLTAISSFNTLASQYTTLVTEEDARTMAINSLGQQIITQLELYFANPDAFADVKERQDFEAKVEAQKAAAQAEAEALRRAQIR